MPFNDMLKAARLKKKLTQPEIAKVLGVSAQFVSNMESGKAYPPANLFNKYMKKLGLPTIATFNLMLGERVHIYGEQLIKLYGVEQ